MQSQQQQISQELQDKIRTFTREDVLRKFQILTQTDTVYVNLYFLAEISEYFYILLTGNYTEKSLEKVELDDVFTDDLVIFLSHVCAQNFEFERTINQQNICSLVYFSDRLIVPSVKAEIKKYLSSDKFKDDQYEIELLISLCYHLHSQGYQSTDIDQVFKKIARLSNTDLVDKAVDAVPDREIRITFKERIIHFRPYLYQPRPQSFFDWNDTRARLFF